MKKILFCLSFWMAVSDRAAETNVAMRLEDIALAAANPERLTSMVQEALTSPDTFNAAVHMLQHPIVGKDGKTNSYLQIIKDLNINFKVFDADTTRGEPGLGFSYAFDRAVAGRTINDKAENPLGLSF